MLVLMVLIWKNLHESKTRLPCPIFSIVCALPLRTAQEIDPWPVVGNGDVGMLKCMRCNMQSCIVTCSSSSSFWRAIISNTQIHVCMRANRKGANNLCNYTQSPHPSPYLCTSCHLDFFAFTQSATTWNDADGDTDDVDQHHHHQIYNFLERSTRIPLRLFCSKNTNRIELHCNVLMLISTKTARFHVSHMKWWPISAASTLLHSIAIALFFFFILRIS